MGLTSVNAGNVMDNNNRRPSSLPNGEVAMDTNDWRTRLPPGSRHKIVNKITETLKKHFPFAGPEGVNELSRVAATFEEKILNIAVSPSDYLYKISMKMLTMDPISHNSAGSSPSVFADDNSLPSALGRLNLMENDNSEYQGTVINTGDWRDQLPQDSRQQNISKLMETVKKHVPYSGQEGLDELMRIAISFEDLIFSTAINQVDYFHKISLKMESMEGGN